MAALTCDGAQDADEPIRSRQRLPHGVVRVQLPGAAILELRAARPLLRVEIGGGASGRARHADAVAVASRALAMLPMPRHRRRRRLISGAARGRARRGENVHRERVRLFARRGGARRPSVRRARRVLRIERLVRYSSCRRRGSARVAFHGVRRHRDHGVCATGVAQRAKPRRFEAGPISHLQSIRTTVERSASRRRRLAAFRAMSPCAAPRDRLWASRWFTGLSRQEDGSAAVQLGREHRRGHDARCPGSRAPPPIRAKQSPGPPLEMRAMPTRGTGCSRRTGRRAEAS